MLALIYSKKNRKRSLFKQFFKLVFTSIEVLKVKKNKANVTDKMWQAYFDEPTIENRNKLVEKYYYYVHHLVNKHIHEIPKGLPVEDVIQSGFEALIRAIERFEPIDGNRFESYANIRITGEIRDTIRQYKRNALGISRIKSTKIREFIEKRNELEQKLQRKSRKEEVANYLGISVEEYEKVLKGKEVKFYFDNDLLDLSSVNDDYDNPLQNPEEIYFRKETLKHLREELEKLSYIDREIIERYYFKDQNFREIGEILKLTESRISQIHRKTLNKLRSSLEGKRVV